MLSLIKATGWQANFKKWKLIKHINQNMHSLSQFQCFQEEK